MFIYYSFSKLYILTELRANDVKVISVDRQKLDLSKYIYLWYRKFYICRDTARFYEHKKMTLVNEVYKTSRLTFSNSTNLQGSAVHVYCRITLMFVVNLFKILLLHSFEIGINCG